MAENAPTDKLQRLARVAHVFTPGAPVNRYALFGGRMEQVLDVLNTVGQRGQHVMLYGERGVGKTSLANVLAEIFAGKGDTLLRSVGVNCQTNDSYATVWSNVFRELERDGNLTIRDGMVPSEPEQVRFALEELESPALIVIDELDRLEDEEALSLLADTIKTLSDHSTLVTLVLVGVADSVDQLIGDHQSVSRALTQIHVPRMSVPELEEIIEKGLHELDLSASRAVKRRIARLSEGLPHYTHLLALHSSQRAIADDRDEVQNVDVDRAVDLAVQKAQHSIRTAYEKATRTTRNDTLFEEALLAAALAPKGPLGHFTAGSVRQPMSTVLATNVEIAKFNRHLNAFTEESRGAVLEKSGEPRRWFYRFRDPLLQPYVVLNGLAQKRIGEDAVAALQQARDDGSDIAADERLFPA
jgi:energy-coupling factor transporter ATP-binding protein EcfA2